MPRILTGVTRAIALTVLLAGAAVLFAACSDTAKPEPTPTAVPTPDTPYGAIVLNPREKPDLVIPDTNGRPFDLRAETEGKLTLVYLGYTFCPDICPVEMAELSAGMQLVDPAVRDEVVIIFITVDPERDKPDVLAKWLDLFDAEIVGLVPKPGEVPDIAKSFGMEVPQRAYMGDEYYTVSHAAYVRAYLTDNMGRYIFPVGFSPEMWKHDLELLVTNKERFTP